jgi:hypothetical protein
MLVKGTRSAGRCAQVWNGTDSGGEPVVRGVYFHWIQVGDQSPAVQKMIKMG